MLINHMFHQKKIKQFQGFDVCKIGRKIKKSMHQIFFTTMSFCKSQIKSLKKSFCK
jgi:hypothetical protein